MSEFERDPSAAVNGHLMWRARKSGEGGEDEIEMQGPAGRTALALIQLLEAEQRWLSQRDQVKVRQDRKCKKSILVSDKGRREALGEETVELLKEEEQVAVLERSRRGRDVCPQRCTHRKELKETQHQRFCLDDLMKDNRAAGKRRREKHSREQHHVP